LSAKEKMSAVILAGGKSSRMGQNKMFLPLGGKPVILHLLEVVKQVFAECIVVTDEPALYQNYAVKVVQDIIVCREKNSLTGIHAGLFTAQYPFAFMLAGDMPFVQPQVLSYLCTYADDCDVVVPKEGRFYQPLCAIYHKNCLPLIEKQLRDGIFRIDRFFPQVRLCEVDIIELKHFDPKGYTFFNINTPEDYVKACKIYQMLQCQGQFSGR